MEVLKETSVLDISKIIKTKYQSLKFFWIFSILILASLSGYNLFNISKKYLDYDVFTQINFWKDTPYFPAISFCFPYIENITKYLQDHPHQFLFNTELIKYNELEVFSSNQETCLRFNTEKSKNENIEKSTNTNFISGLIANLNLKYFFRNASNNQILPYKLKIYIDNQSSIFRPKKLDYSGMIVNSGGTFFKIDRKYIENLPSPYNSCVKQNTDKYVSYLFEYFIKNNKTYSQKDCLELCLEESSLDKCNCSKNLGVIFECPRNKSDCFLDEIYNLSKNIPEQCFDYCPNECDSMTFEIQQTYSGIAPLDYLEAYNLSNKFNNNAYLIYIFYSDFDYLHLKQLPKMDGFDFFSQMGGTLSLFIGLSLLSFIEIIEAFCQIVLNHFQNRILSVDVK